MAKLSAKKQDEQIKAEIARLESLLADLPEDRRSLARDLIERVAFMTVTLRILEGQIKSKGPTYEFVQGKQRMIVENPAQKSYTTMVQRYTAAYEKLFGLLPKDQGARDQDDGFEGFVEDRD